MGLLAGGTVLGCTVEKAALVAPPRVEQVLSAGWRFQRGDAAEAEAPELDDSPAEWSSVSLYRDVHLRRVNAVHVDLNDDGASGVYLSTSNVSSDAADLTARVRVTNDDADSGRGNKKPSARTRWRVMMG
jgi:hypothetical protein